MSFIGRMKVGWGYLKKSVSIFFSRKEFLLFPVLKTLTFIFLVGLFALLIHIFVGWNTFQEFLNLFNKDKPCHPEFIDYIILITSSFVINFLATFVTAFFAISLCDFALNVINNSGAPVSVSFNHAKNRLGKITKWALFTAFAMLILKIIDAVLKKFKLSILAKIFNFLGEVAWMVATFFIYPVLAFEDLGTADSVKHSFKTLRDCFGESITGMFMFDVFPVLLFIPYVTVSFASAVGFYFILVQSFGVSNNLTNVLCFAITPLWILIYFYIAVFGTLMTIFKTAIYSSLIHEGGEIFPLHEIKELSSYKKKK